MKALRILILVLLSATAFAQRTTVYSGGLTTPNTWTQTQTFLGPVAVLNGAYNAASCGGANPPSWCSGSDIGAWINAAAGACVSGQQCHIVIPSTGRLNFSTPIVYVPNETIECTRMGEIANDTSEDAAAILSYTGTGDTAVAMAVGNGRFIGCDLLLGSSATTGILIGGTHAYSNRIEDASIRGGGTRTTLVHVSCLAGACEDNHVINSRVSNFAGIGVSIDHSNDTHLFNNTVYGEAGNTTSISLLIDSAAGGVNVDGFIGGSSGLHGMVVRHTLGGAYPNWGFIHNFQCDLASSDCILFDLTLKSAVIGYTLIDSWAAGAGGAGIHVAGGSNINIGGGTKVRVNAHDGILIDGGAEVGIQIHDSIIQGNNTANGEYNGISIHDHPNSVTISGNHINNYPESGGHQQYALKTYSDVEELIFANNNCGNNVLGCSGTSTVNGAKMTYSGNIGYGVDTPTNYFPGLVVTSGLRVIPVLFSAFSSCTSGLEGQSVPVTNSATATYNATVTGGGTNHIVAYCNGTNWVAH